MAATAAKKGRSRVSAVAALILGVVFFLLGAAHAQDNQEVRRRVSDVAMALTAANPAGAMEPFDKTFSDYGKLRDYFSALTNAYQVGSEVEVTDEQEAGDGVHLTVRWTLTLTEPRTNSARNRTGDIEMRLVRKKGQWQIVNFTPIALFDPNS